MVSIELPAKIEQGLDRIDSIATLPGIATEVLELMRSSRTSMAEIAAVIEGDPSIAAKILKVANSPVWGQTGQVESTQRALIILGTRQVSNLIIAVSLYSQFANLKPHPLFDRKRFWTHSAGTAQIARRLSNRLKFRFQGEEFLAGLLHDLGKVLLDQYWPEEFERVLDYCDSQDVSFLQAEQTMLNLSHAHLAAYLLEQWNFPVSLRTAVAMHHTPLGAHNHRLLTAIIASAEILCEQIGLGSDPDVVDSDLLSSDAWSVVSAEIVEQKSFNLDEFIEELGDVRGEVEALEGAMQ